jgi:multiple sugar transport system substrate-binding protein/raffinose/stachyose/melibiose transport system substrate-binding protein
MLIRLFQEKEPQLKFERSSQDGGTAQYLKQTPPPDLVNVDAGQDLLELSRNAQVADLTELWAESGLTEHIPPGLRQLTAYQDRQFYVPVAVGWKAIYYNKQIFADYNLTPPQSWDEFMAICETLMANGVTPLAISGNESYAIVGWFEYLNLRINGPEFYRDLLLGKEHYDDPRVRKVMETWSHLFQQGYFVEKPNALGDLASMTSIIRGDKGMLGVQRAAMVLANTYMYGQMPAPFQSEVDFFRFPTMDPSIPDVEIVEPFGYAVPVGADHLAASMAFLGYVSSAEGQSVAAQAPMYQTVQYLPARNDVDTQRLTAEQRKALKIINEADAQFLAFYYAVPGQMFGQVYYRFIRFVDEPTKIDEFMSKFEEVRKDMVEKGVLLVE